MTSRKLISTIVLAVCCILSFAAERTSTNKVVIVTSYNPDVKSISDNLSAFTEQFSNSGCDNEVVLESMNCKNLSESLLWKTRLWELLEKYYENGNSPAAIVLLGNEASSTFFSMDKEELKRTPAIFGMRGDNITLLPEDPDTNLDSWNPETKYLSKDFSDFNIVGGIAYSYDIEKGLDMLKGLSMKIDTLAFISDNSFGGVTMLSHFNKVISSMPQYNVKYFDGRTTTFPQLNQKLSTLGKNTAIVIGTWRVDSTDSYALNNTTYTLAYSNPSVPAITLASVGLGHWALGGYVPSYGIQGGKIASILAEYLKTGEPQEIQFFGNHYTLDYNVAERLDYSAGSLGNYDLLNKPTSFFEQNKAIIIATTLIILFLLFCLAVTSYLLKQSKEFQKVLKDHSEQLAIERDRAEKASAMKSSFIANISHEIRTPLNAVVGFSQLISNDELELTTEEKADFSNHILMNSKVLLNLIDEVLDLSKMDANRIVYNIRECDLVEIAESAADSARLELDPNVRIIVNSTASHVSIETDKERLYQVFCNLLSNAKKFTKEGSITIDINAESTDHVTVSVTDTGSGIPEEKASSIFERFIKLDHYKQGTGLGLSIVKTILQHFKGDINLDTSYKDGARFVFTHPYHQKSTYVRMSTTKMN